MKINELTPRMGNVELLADVVDVSEVRQFNKFGKEGKVATARLKDETGEIEMPLWNEQVDQVGKGDTIKITNCYVKEYQGEIQLTTGMRGTIEVVKKAERTAAAERQQEPEAQNFDRYAEMNDAIEKPALDEEKIEED